MGKYVQGRPRSPRTQGHVIDTEHCRYGYVSISPRRPITHPVHAQPKHITPPPPPPAPAHNHSHRLPNVAVEFRYGGGVADGVAGEVVADAEAALQT